MGNKALRSQVVSHSRRLCKIKYEQPKSPADAAPDGSQSCLATLTQGEPGAEHKPAGVVQRFKGYIRGAEHKGTGSQGDAIQPIRGRI